jgi:hypothetical protein
VSQTHNMSTMEKLRRLSNRAGIRRNRGVCIAAILAVILGILTQGLWVGLSWLLLSTIVCCAAAFFIGRRWDSLEAGLRGKTRSTSRRRRR